MKDFIETKASKVKKVRIDYEQGAPPELIMYDDKGEIAKTVNVGEWKSDTIVEFLADKLDDAPAAKVKKTKVKGKAKGKAKSKAKGKAEAEALLKKYESRKTAGDADADADSDHLSAGVAYAGKGDYERATQAFQAAVKFGADDKAKARAHVNLGVIGMRTQDLQGASEHLMTAVELDPTNRDAAQNLQVLQQIAAQMQAAR